MAFHGEEELREKLMEYCCGANHLLSLNPSLARRSVYIKNDNYYVFYFIVCRLVYVGGCVVDGYTGSI